MPCITAIFSFFEEGLLFSLEPSFQGSPEPASQATSAEALHCVAPQRSGALITAGFALEQGREVFAVPGNILSSRSTGVNKLIQDGARPVLNVNDILGALNLFMVPQHVEMQATLPESEDERTLIALLSHEPLHVDELIRQSELPTMTVSATLLEMELKGMIKRVGSMQYVLAR